MKTIKLLQIIMILAMLGSSGCASYIVYKGSAEQVALKKAMATNNEKAIRDINAGIDPSGSGVSVGFGEAISERPVLQTVAAVVDVAVGYVGYKGLENATGSSNEDSKDNARSADNNTSGENTVNVNGDGNTITVSGSGGNGLSTGETPPLTVTP